MENTDNEETVTEENSLQNEMNFEEIKSAKWDEIDKLLDRSCHSNHLTKFEVIGELPDFKIYNSEKVLKMMKTKILRLTKNLVDYCCNFPVLGFNSSKYDLDVIKKLFVQY